MSDAHPPSPDGHQQRPPISDETYARVSFWSNLFRSFNKLVFAGLCIGVAYFIYLTADTLAGQETVVDASFSVMKRAMPSWWGILTGLAVVWALGERSLRRRKVRSMESHVKRLETIIDPNRSSSGLRPDGTTNPEDE